ncbi:MAG: phytanoyl-CoA dioxygenase family protein [Verrucomicrobia bacterium]|nr:phytanoyl-CoA dioxygenase family protein [Verrucomicrobiota bacterium]
MNQLTENGFEIRRSVFTVDEVQHLKEEADRVASMVGSTCVRHLRHRSQIFHDLAVSQRLLNLIAEPVLAPVRSILFDKTTDENWPVAWHQDLTIAVKAENECPGYAPWTTKDGVPHVQPPTQLLQRMVTIRVHLDLTDSNNGALIVVPRSHLRGRIPSAAIANEIAAGTYTCECDPGDVLLMAPLLLHSSRRSAVPHRRRIVHFEYAPADALHPSLTWFE